MKKFTRIKTLFVVLLVTGCGGCVSRISMSEQSPTPSYQSKERTVVSIIDKRDSTKIGNPLNYIGRLAASAQPDNSGSSLMVYPFLTGSTKDKTKKTQTLAGFLEERIVFGLMEGEWNVLPGELSDRPQNTDIINLMKEREAQKLLLIELKEWHMNIHLKFVSAYANFDWNINVEIIDSDAQSILKTSIKGRDVVDIKAKDSLSNLILKAYRDRLQNIFEEPKIKEALTKNY